MMKTSVFSASLVVLLCGPALAQPSPSPSPPPQPRPAPPSPRPATAPQALTVEVSIQTPAGTRSYELVMLDRGCQDIAEKTVNHDDHVTVCGDTGSAAGLTLRGTWRVRAGTSETSGGWAAVVAPGAVLDVGRASTTQVSIRVK